MTPLFELHQISVRYGARTVLSISELTINQGEAWALIGPSGAGKSTLLRLLCLLERPTTGQVRYATQSLDRAVPLTIQRQIVLIFQRPLLLDTTVWHNVAYGLKLRGRRDDQLAAATLEQLGLSHLAQARATTLSGGEMQRVAVARALVIRPQVLLLDEPTANLDPQNVALIEQAVGALRRDHGTTLVLATHNLHQARRLTTHAAMLLEGSLIEAGSSHHVLEQPCDAKTRAFVRGDMIY